jgi:hypothetical protein
MEAIPAPLDLLDNSFEEAYDALKTHGMQHGYGCKDVEVITGR